MFARNLEQNVRSLQTDRIHIRIIGFAQLMGDLIAGLLQVMAYFAVAAAIAAAIIFFFTRCLRSTMSIIGCTIVAVIWQLGVVRLLGYSLDPYSILVPFLVFAIGVSHGSQKMNGIMQDIGRGTHRYVAARYTFRRLFLAGLTALLADVGGFAVLTMIDIPVIRGLAVTAAVGVGILIFTNLLLLPVVLSYVGVNPKAAQRSLAAEAHTDIGVLHFFNRFTDWRWATIAILCAIGLAWGAYSVSQQLQIGDLDPGAPELWPNSRYNQDNTYITGHYGLSSDEFAVIVKMPPKGIRSFESIVEMDRLEQTLRQLDGVQTTFSAASLARMYTSGGFEGYPKWMTISRDYNIFNDSVSYAYIGNPELFNVDGSIAPVVVYLQDHKAATLTRMVTAVQKFADAHNTPQHQFLLAAGSAGIEAATNIVVSEANDRMLYWVYAAVIVLCFITFRSWRAVVVAILPLVVTSILCEALMVKLGIGVKVATLPVLALGVGIGVDYALYLLSIQLKWQREGVPLPEAYARAMRFTGKIVMLVGITLASGVITWAWSPIKFQANMGVLLTFMFLWNMIGALVLIPALSVFLLPTSHFRNKSKSSMA
jgi:predicted RND superfamily exporter protein